jgi:hypothetical protein
MHHLWLYGIFATWAWRPLDHDEADELERWVVGILEASYLEGLAVWFPIFAPLCSAQIRYR